MVWVRLDDGFTRHPRMVAAGLHGRALFIAGLCYCGTHLTDGMIPRAAFPMLAAEAGVPARTAAKLIEVGSWIDKGDHIEVHDFLVYNPSRAKVLAERAAGAERQRKSRESRRDAGVTDTATDGVSAGDPSRPVPSPPPSSSSNGFHKLPANLWTRTAEEKLKLQPDGTVNNPAKWLATTARNARDELSTTAQDWWDRYDVTPLQLASALAAGKVPQQWNNCRRPA